MSKQAQDMVEDEALDLEPEAEQEDNVEEQEEAEQDEAEATEEEDEGELEVGFASDEQEEEPEQERRGKSEDFVKMRQNYKENKRRVKELEAKLAQLEESKKESVLGPKPKIADFDYDEDAYEEAFAAWTVKKADADKKEREERLERENALKRWEEKLEQYNTSKQSLKVKDYEDAEFNVQESLSELQQNIIIELADDPSLLVYAIGKNTNKLQKLANIQDPGKFIKELGKLEAELSVKKRKAATQPERKVTSSESVSSFGENKLDKLRAEAAKTGDMSKVLAYRLAIRKQ